MLEPLKLIRQSVEGSVKLGSSSARTRCERIYKLIDVSLVLGLVARQVPMGYRVIILNDNQLVSVSTCDFVDGFFQALSQSLDFGSLHGAGIVRHKSYQFSCVLLLSR